MPIERVIGGVIYEFPDNTPEAVIRRFETQKSGTPSPVAPTPVPRAPRPEAFSTGPGSQFLQGLTMGFSDEAIAALRAAKGQGKYEDLVKAEREALRKYGEERPVVGGAAELAGAIAPAVINGGASLIPGASRALAQRIGPRAAELLLGTKPTVGRMAATGAGTGAVTAVGTSEQPGLELPAEAAKGAVLGGAGAGAVGAIGKYVAAPAFARLKTSLGFGSADRAADLAIAQALRKDGLTPDQALAALQASQRGEMTLADVGENTAALLRRASAAPGESRRFVKGELAGRELERVSRVSDDLRTLMSGSKDFFTDVQDLMKKRSSDANALYSAAYSAGPLFGPNTAPEIAKLKNLPSFDAAMRAGAKRMADQGVDISDPRNTLRALHETKLALDDMIETAMRGGQTNQAKTLIGMKERMLRDMERASPEYRIAREAYAGDSEMLAAMSEGKNIYGMPEMDMRKLIQRFQSSPSEYDAFRAGIAQAMLERLRAGGPSADPLKTVFPKGVEEKVRRAFRDDAAFDQFKARLLEERQMLGTEKTGFRRTPLDTDLDAGAAGVGAATNLLAGRPVTAAMEAIRAQFPNIAGMPESVAAPVTQRLLTPAQQTDQVIQGILGSLKSQEEQLLRMTGATGTGAAMVGGLSAARPVKQQYPEETTEGAGMPPMPPGASPLRSMAP